MLSTMSAWSWMETLKMNYALIATKAGLGMKGKKFIRHSEPKISQTQVSTDGHRSQPSTPRRLEFPIFTQICPVNLFSNINLISNKLLP